MKEAAHVFISLMFLIASAYISFDINIGDNAIPFTAQSLAVFIIAGLLKPKEFLAVILTYLVIGIIGMPVFADGSSGFDKIKGASGGFLYGFIFSGLFISYFTTYKSKKGSLKGLSLYFLATFILFFFGLLHLAIKLDFPKAIEYGFHPFWRMGLIKAILACIIVILIKRFFKIKALNN